MTTPGRRWAILLAYWCVQAVVLIVVFTAVYGTIAGGEWDPMPLADYLQVWQDEEMLLLFAIWVPLLTGLQCLLLLPLQMRVKRGRRGRSVYFSMAAAGAFLALVVTGFGAALAEVIVLYSRLEPEGWSAWMLFGGLGLSWLVFTVLLVRYARRSSRETDDLLTHVARIVFAGTVVETIALIPLDVMVRRKTDCYCFTGSLWALMLSGAVGIVVAGPAVLLPLLSPRPRWLRAGRCEWCGYDRTGLDAAAVCPECGCNPNGKEPNQKPATQPPGDRTA